MKILMRLINAIEKASNLAGRVAMYFVALLMLVVSYEVVARYAFNAPTIWAGELSGYLMTAFVALGAAYTLRKGKFVNVDMLYIHLSDRAKTCMRLCTYPITILFLFFFLKYVTRQLVLAIQEMQVSGTAWDPLLWPIKLALFIGVGLTLLQVAADLTRDLYMLATKKQSGSFSSREKEVAK